MWRLDKGLAHSRCLVDAAAFTPTTCQGTKGDTGAGRAWSACPPALPAAQCLVTETGMFVSDKDLARFL